MATRLQRLRREGLTETFLFAGPGFRKAAPWLMATVLFAGLLTRLHPTVRYAVWGSDSGEYIFLTRQLAETGRVLFDYDGWGLAYPYFPGMFTVSAAVHSVIGIRLEHAVLWTTPALAAIVPVLVGLLAYRVTSDPRVGVVAGAFVAVSGAIVITTSHAMPGTLGQLFLLALLALMPDAYRDRLHFPILGILALALLLTHHLTTYFAAGILALIPFYREVTQLHSEEPRLRIEVPLAVLVVGMAAVWWLGIAAPFREQIVGDALDLSPWATALLFLLALALLPVLAILKRRHSRWFLIPRYPGFRRQRTGVLGLFFGLVAIVTAFILVELPGTNMQLEWATLSYALPVMVFVAFVPMGLATLRFYKAGSIVASMLYALLASLAFAVATSSRVLFPFRHVDYLMMAMAPLAALGVLMVYDQTMASRIPAERSRVRAQLVMALVALLAVSAVLSLPPRETLAGFEEGIGRNEVAAVDWVADHPEIIPPGSAMAADHRVSSLLWGLAGIHATWDYTPETYHAENVTAVAAELRSLDIPAGDDRRVDYVFVSPQIEEGVTLVQWENSEPMSAAARAKFEDTLFFTKLYDVDGVRIYRIEWDALEAAGAPGASANAQAKA